MLTPDQVRLRLENLFVREDPGDRDLGLLVLLMEVLPDLVASARPAQRPESQCSEEVQEDIRSLRRALHLSELSRGVPSPVGRD